jgi:hypothetical protein
MALALAVCEVEKSRTVREVELDRIGRRVSAAVRAIVEGDCKVAIRIKSGGLAVGSHSWAPFAKRRPDIHFW